MHYHVYLFNHWGNGAPGAYPWSTGVQSGHKSLLQDPECPACDSLL